jgi:phospholipid transport system transporter-binding protein
MSENAAVLPAAPARLTQAEFADYLRTCEAAAGALSAGQEARLDASALQTFDSSALAVLLAVRRRVLSVGAQLRIVGLPQRLRDLATLYGVSELLPA